MSDSKGNNGIGICGLLGVVFVTLKLCGVINWSWWWVTAPLYLPPVMLIFAAFVLVFFGVIETGGRR